MIITPYAAAHGDGEQKVVQSPEGGDTSCIGRSGMSSGIKKAPYGAF